MFLFNSGSLTHAVGLRYSLRLMTAQGCGFNRSNFD